MQGQKAKQEMMMNKKNDESGATPPTKPNVAVKSPIQRGQANNRVAQKMGQANVPA